MSQTYCGSKENKENQYLHEVQVSPTKGRNNGRRNNLPQNHYKDCKRQKEDDIVSPTLLKTRKQLVELWLNPVISLDTSLEQLVEDDESPYECDCLKEHLT